MSPVISKTKTEEQHISIKSIRWQDLRKLLHQCINHNGFYKDEMGRAIKKE
jgi:hypothetical protein